MRSRTTIRYSRSLDEYRVSGPRGTEAQAYYTNDGEDAIGTARLIYGSEVLISFRNVE